MNQGQREGVIDSPGGRTFNRQSITPNPARPQGFQFETPRNIQKPQNKQGPKIEFNKKPSINIQPKEVKKGISIVKPGSNTQYQQAPPPTIAPPPVVQRPATPTQHPQTFNPPANPVFAPPQVMPQQQQIRPQSPQMPQPTPTIQPQISQPAAKPVIQAQPQQQAATTENYNRLSLLSFVSAFEDGKSFNETDLATLGLDLKCQEPLLPMLHSVLSDAPLLEHSCHPTPECYSKILPTGEPQEKISLFTDQTLLFIFYTYTNNPLQIQAADELIKRGITFDEETCEWHPGDGIVWNCDTWKEQQEIVPASAPQVEE